jgi:hypothetical protein
LNWCGGAKRSTIIHRDGLTPIGADSLAGAKLLRRCSSRSPLVRSVSTLPSAPDRTQQGDFDHEGHGCHHQAHQPALDTAEKWPLRNVTHDVIPEYTLWDSSHTTRNITAFTAADRIARRVVRSAISNLSRSRHIQQEFNLSEQPGKLSICSRAKNRVALQKGYFDFDILALASVSVLVTVLANRTTEPFQAW